MSDSFLRQLGPLELDPNTGEIFWRLPAPLSHIVLTPPRPSDVPANMAAMNDPKVYRWISSPPWPYELKHGLEWNGKIVAESNALIKQLEAASESGPDAPMAILEGCPVRVIREQNPDGTDSFIGDCGFVRAPFEWELDAERRQSLKDENNARKTGDPDIVWSMGDFLVPSHHGKGIMSAVVKLLVEQWAVPRMNARHICPTAFEANYGSIRVFTKMGFTETKVVRDAVYTKAKGEFPAEQRTIVVLEYHCSNAE